MSSKRRGRGRLRTDKKEESKMSHEEHEGSEQGEMLSLDETSQDESPLLSAIQALRNDFSTQLSEVIKSNREIKEAIGAFSERLTTAETRISSAED